MLAENKQRCFYLQFLLNRFLLISFDLLANIAAIAFRRILLLAFDTFKGTINNVIL